MVERYDSLATLTQEEFTETIKQERELLLNLKDNINSEDCWKFIYSDLTMFSVSIMQWGVFNNDRSKGVGVGDTYEYMKKKFPRNVTVLKNVKELIKVRCEYAQNNFKDIHKFYQNNLSRIEVVEFIFKEVGNIVSQSKDVVV